MLFDLEDYVISGMLGHSWDNIMDLIDNGVINKYGNETHGGDFEDQATTSRATRDAFFKAVNEYAQAARVTRFEISDQIENWMISWNDAKIELGPSWKTFWDAYCSIPYLGGRLGGEEAFVLNTGRDFTIMTQEIYDEYHLKFSATIQLVKELFELGEGSPIIE